MNGSHEGPVKPEQGATDGSHGALKGVEESIAGKRIDRRRLVLTTVAAAPVLMTLGAKTALAQPVTTDMVTTNNYKKNSSGMASGNSSIIKRRW